jgi:dTMP kinase
MKEMKFYGTALPGTEIEPYPGKLIVIEGTDGVGRSTHVALLRTWLESAGHAVLDTGMTRSVLAGRGIKNARTGHTLGRLTLQLYYAQTSRTVWKIKSCRPCARLRRADRSLHLLGDRPGTYAAPIRNGFEKFTELRSCLMPVFTCACIPPKRLARRVLASGRGFDYWESGMDLGLANDYYDSLSLIKSYC